MPRREDVQPVESEGHLDGKKYSHPAFGLVSASRVSGNRTLFGTDFIHRNFVVIRVRPAELQRSLAHDWVGPSGQPFVEVALSEAQWATLVSSLNVGQGVPCTLEYVNGEEMPGIPHRETSAVHKAEFKERVKEITELVAKTRRQIDAELGLPKKKKDTILAHLVRLEQDLSQNMPWYTKVLEEQMHNTVESAKVEVSAYINAMITRTGLSALTDGAAPPLSLSSGDSDVG